MKKRKKRNLTTAAKPNQLSFDFNVNNPIEIHKPKFDISDLRKELAWEHRPIIEIVRS